MSRRPRIATLRVTAGSPGAAARSEWRRRAGVRAAEETSHVRDLFTIFAFQQLLESWVAEVEREQGWKCRGRGDDGEAGHGRRRATRRRGRARIGVRARTPTAAESIDRRPFRAWLARRLIALALLLAPGMRPGSIARRGAGDSP